MTASLPDVFSLTGKKAVVTGGNRGLGYAMARALAEASAEVVITGRDRAVLDKSAEQLSEQTAGRVVPVAVDVTSAEQIDAMTAEALEALGRIDILVNNAGINIRESTLTQSEANFRKILDTNLVGAFLVAQSVGRHLVAQRSGTVIHVASMLGFVGLADRPGYTASKGGLIQLTRTMALEWAGSGVRVNALCPGPFATEINTPVVSDPEANRFFIERIPLGRWGRPDELAGAIVFLASDASSFMTGATLVVDGGWSAQ